MQKPMYLAHTRKLVIMISDELLKAEAALVAAMEVKA